MAQVAQHPHLFIPKLCLNNKWITEDHDYLRQYSALLLFAQDIHNIFLKS